MEVEAAPMKSLACLWRAAIIVPIKPLTAWTGEDVLKGTNMCDIRSKGCMGFPAPESNTLPLCEESLP
jgi:hypothetical protein